MLKTIRIFLLAIAFNCNIQAQVNLVPNPSFEIYDTCPDLTSKISYALGWYNPNLHSPDYHNSCSPSIYYSTPVNFIGNQSPRSGSGYAGIGIAGYNGSREYIAVQLSSQLVSGTKYYIEFFVSLADSCNYCTDNLGACLTVGPLFENSTDSINYIPVFKNSAGNFINDKINWTKISGYFLAAGNEQYLTLGNFNGAATTNTLSVSNGGSTGNPNYAGAYLYIDDVTVIDSVLVGVSELHSSQDLIIEASDDNIIIQIRDTRVHNICLYNSLGQLLENRLVHDNEKTVYFSSHTIKNQMCFITYEVNSTIKTKKIIVK